MIYQKRKWLVTYPTAVFSKEDFRAILAQKEVEAKMVEISAAGDLCFHDQLDEHGFIIIEAYAKGCWSTFKLVEETDGSSSVQE